VKIAVIGLGNPGNKYLLTRHNMGYIILDRLAKTLSKNFSSSKLFSSIKQNIGTTEYIFVKPKTYMNLSYKAVEELMSSESVDKLIIIYDDKDLEVGRLKIKSNSSSSHNGVSPIIEKFPNVIHFRIGIGNKKPLSEYVLSDFTKSELIIISEVIDKVIDAIYDYPTLDMNELQNKYNKF
jgi:PTH1 family peptidyl-tRNA hydrolase